MSDKINNQQNNMPVVTVAAFIVNKKGELLLTRGNKWKNMIVPPAGKLDHGELPEDAVIREIKEELGVDIKNPELIEIINMVDSEDFTPGKLHFVGFEYKAEMVDDSQEITLNDEASEYFWIKPEDVVKEKDIEFYTKKVIEKGFLSKKKKGFLKKCKNCNKNETEMEEYKAGWLRAQADYKNLQKEISEQRSEWARMSEQTILEDFIPVYDNFKLAFGHQPTDFSDSQKKWSGGIGYIMKQFEKVLQDHNIVEIRTEGELFNPDMHEAVGEEESEGDEGRILREVSGGYMMGSKVIKVAKVVVSK